MLGQVALLHKLIWPERLQQFILAGDSIPVIDEIKQQIEAFAIQRNRLSSPLKSPSGASQLHSFQIRIR